MKLLGWLEWIAFAVSLVSILGVAAFLYAWMPLFTKPSRIDHTEAVANARGEVAEAQIRDCAILGSAAEFRISHRLAEASDFTQLVYCAFRDDRSSISWLDNRSK